MSTRLELYKNIESNLTDLLRIFYDHKPGENLLLSSHKCYFIMNTNIKSIQDDLETLKLIEE